MFWVTFYKLIYYIYYAKPPNLNSGQNVYSLRVVDIAK